LDKNDFKQIIYNKKEINMIKIQIDDTIYTCKDSWKDLSVLDGLNFPKQLDDELEIDFRLRCIEYLTNIPLDILNTLNVSDFNELVKILNNFNELPANDTLGTTELEVKINDSVYTIKRYVDLKTEDIRNIEFISASKMDESDKFNNYLKVLLRIKSGDDLDLMTSLDFETALVLINNFFAGAVAYTSSNTQKSLNPQSQESRLKIVNS
jgi:hypothetical protein